MEIHCATCDQDALVARQPVYEGFKKVGEEFVCTLCGHVYPTEEDVPFKEADASLSIFSEADRVEKPRVFSEQEGRQLCRYCAHYVVNPFTQWCGFHKMEVAATDTCGHFAIKVEPPHPI